MHDRQTAQGIKDIVPGQLHLKDKSIPASAGEGEQKDVALKMFFE